MDANFTFPFEDNSFDYVVSVETIEHLEYLWNLINESYRVLRGEGGEIDIYYS
ncbi:methyltransferase domain-containing protein [Methanobrevibacter arboriphilus]|uniref:methyltransferase domain-containing protein n=1 Tax=Methanobrevibacter arboriphilus TaxID=39441 RepID=UPI00373FCEF0